MFSIGRLSLSLNWNKENLLIPGYDKITFVTKMLSRYSAIVFKSQRQITALKAHKLHSCLYHFIVLRLSTLLQNKSALAVPASLLLTADSTAAGPAARARHSVARS